jgi:hypothetical protein
MNVFRPLPTVFAGALVAAVTAGTASAQVTIGTVLSDNQTAIPQGNPANNSFSENVDFGDVDRDGDWDAIFADGGDQGNDQNRIWINFGGLQAGTLGQFQDETATRFPVFQDDSRDIEFGDFEADGDLDIYVSNTAQLQNQGNRWLINQGLAQAGALGFYVDETASRWVGLGVSGSSIPAGALIAGSFIDWSCDCDFGDLDNDGDLDLVHSSYGGAFGGEVPTRLFLNDGSGHFAEFNPSGFQLPGNNINNGNPAVWCQGTQSANTTNSNGTNADIASSALDIDVGDIDGDYDLDILHGAREQLPRMFTNRLEENGGALLGFRDVTGSAFPAGYSAGNGHYEQEMGDMDADGDLDIYGLNWLIVFGFDDQTLRNNGAGVFSIIEVLGASSGDDNEGDFFDYDNDGHLDLFVAAFGGANRLYDGNGTGNLTHLPAGISGQGFTSLDADCCDVDGDLDYDVFQSNDGGARNQYFENITIANDTRAPYIPRVENDGNRTATTGTFPIRAQVYDNAPYYITWYNEAHLDVEVAGFDIGDVPMASSAGQVFRARMPANLVGAVSYRASSADQYGNRGNSAWQNYTATSAAFTSEYGTGSPGSTGVPTITGLSVPFAGNTLRLGLRGGANVGYYLGYSLASIPTGYLPGFGNLNLDPLTLVLLPGALDAAGEAVFSANLPGTLVPGNSLFLQLFTFDGVGGDLLGTSRGVQLTFQ